jgi:hypothetical protein
MLDSTEQPALVLWLIACLHKYATPFKKELQATCQQQHQAAWRFQHYLIMLSELLNGGLCQEILAGICLDHLHWTSNAKSLMAIVAAEKVAWFKMNQVPISTHLKHYFEFFLKHVWTGLLIMSTSKCTTNVDLLSLWVNFISQPMEYTSYSKALHTVSSEFHPSLHLTSLSF